MPKGNDSLLTLEVRYVYDGMLVVQERNAQNNTAVSYTRGNGQPLQSFGNVGSLAEATTYRFSSKESHANAGLYYFGFRYYEPNLQRWVNRDPIADEGVRQFDGKSDDCLQPAK